MGLLERLAPHLPYVRRYARSLMGDQALGDAYVRVSLEALAAGELQLPPRLSPRVALYHVLHAVLADASLQRSLMAEGERRSAQPRHTTPVTPQARQAFLLTALEGFNPAEAGQILQISASQIEELIGEAQKSIDSELSTDVLIIEDEPVIASDIASIVEAVGHRVAGIATTRKEAVSKFRAGKAGLVLADIKLADGSSGVEAIKDIFSERFVPIIIVTAFPELVLTGERPEPTFLITKPFQPETLKAAIGQALFFTRVPGPISEIIEPSTEIARLPSPAGLIPMSMLNGTVESQSAKPSSDLPENDLLGFTSHICKEADRLLSYGDLLNHPRLRDRIEAIKTATSQPLDSTSSVVFASQTEAFAEVVEGVRQILMEEVAVDVVAFSRECLRLAHRFTLWAAAMSASQQKVSQASGDALISASRQIESSDLLGSNLKSALSSVRADYEETRSQDSAKTLLLILKDIFLVPGRWLIKHLRGVGREFSSEIEKRIAHTVAHLLVHAVPLGTIALLVHAFPQTLSFLPYLLRMISKL